MKQKNMKISVVILMNWFHIGANILLNKIIDDPNIEIKAILIREVWKSGKNTARFSLLRSLLIWGSKEGYFFILALTALTIMHFFKILVFEVFLLSILFKNRNFLKGSSRLAEENNIPIIPIKNINDSNSAMILKDLNPDIILSNNFHQILSHKILDIPKIGCINVHPGILPLYRGLLPHFWSMVNQDKEGGVTIHYMDRGVDTGPILLEEKFLIDKKDSFYNTWKKTADTGSRLLKKYFRLIRSGHKLNPINKSKNNFKKTFFPFPNKETFSKFKANGYKLFRIRDFV